MGRQNGDGDTDTNKTIEVLIVECVDTLMENTNAGEGNALISSVADVEDAHAVEGESESESVKKSKTTNWCALATWVLGLNAGIYVVCISLSVAF